MGKLWRTILLASLLVATSADAQVDVLGGGTDCDGPKTRVQLTGSFDTGSICLCTDCDAAAGDCTTAGSDKVSCVHKGSDVWEPLGNGVSSALTFKTFNAPSGTDPVADALADIINFTSTGGSCVITGDSSTDTLDFACTGFTQEQVEDIVGGMTDDVTETCISVTYDDAAGNMEFVVSVNNACITDVAWSKLTGVPSGLANGDDTALCSPQADEACEHTPVTFGTITMEDCSQLAGTCFIANVPQNFNTLPEPLTGCNGGGFQNNKPVSRCAGVVQRTTAYECLASECVTGECIRANGTCVDRFPQSLLLAPSEFDSGAACTAISDGDCVTVLGPEDSLSGTNILLPIDNAASDDLGGTSNVIESGRIVLDEDGNKYTRQAITVGAGDPALEQQTVIYYPGIPYDSRCDGAYNGGWNFDSETSNGDAWAGCGHIQVDDYWATGIQGSPTDNGGCIDTDGTEPNKLLFEDLDCNGAKSGGEPFIGNVDGAGPLVYDENDVDPVSSTGITKIFCDQSTGMACTEPTADVARIAINTAAFCLNCADCADITVNGFPVCTDTGGGCGGGGDNVKIDTVAVVDPDFQDGGDINFTDTANVVTATIKADKVGLLELEGNVGTPVDFGDFTCSDTACTVDNTAIGAAKIAANAVNYSKIANVAGDDVLLCNWNGAASNVDDCTLGAGLTLGASNVLTLTESDPVFVAMDTIGELNTQLGSTSVRQALEDATDCVVNKATSCDAAAEGGNTCHDQDDDKYWTCDGSGTPTWMQVNAAAGGAPTTADYLVGTADGGLSAEIVVGTTPGGELGNTWASPTIDSGAVLWSELGAPGAAMALNMGVHQTKLTWTAPVTADAAFWLQATGVFTGSLAKIEQLTGNPSTTVLLTLDATDPDTLPFETINREGSTTTTSWKQRWLGASPATGDDMDTAFSMYNASSVEKTAFIQKLNWTDATAGSEDSDLEWKLMEAGAAAVPKMTLSSTGNLQIDGQLQADVTTGTAPLVVASTTVVANLNASNLEGVDLGTLTDTKGCVYDLAGTELDCNSTFLTAEVDGSTTNEIEVVDEAYSAANFNGGTASAVSQDDFYDYQVIADPDDDGKPSVVDLGVCNSDTEKLETDVNGALTCGTIPAAGSGDITDVFSCGGPDCASITMAATDLLDMSGTDASTTTEGLILPQHATLCAGGTADGQPCWEADADILHIGDGVTIKDFVSTAAFSADATVSTTGAVTVADDSHNHGTSTIAALDAGDTTTGSFADGMISDTLTASLSTLAAADTNTTAIATTSFVQQELNGAGGAGLACASGSCATASTETDFVASGALTCTSAQQGRVKVHTTPLQYCDNAATPVLQYAAYGSSTGVATSATALAANGADCATSTHFAVGVDASGVAVCEAVAAADLPAHADAAGDTTTFPLLGLAATGTQTPATDAGLAYNATSDVLTTFLAGGASSVATSPAADDNDTSLATSAYVQTELNAAGGRSITCASGSCDADAELYTQSKSMTIDTPVSADDWLFYRVPQAATITSINCLVIGGTSAIVTVNECDTAGATCSGVDGATTITCATTATADDGSLSNAGIDATDVMRIDVGTVTGSVTQLMVSITYTVTD